MKDPAEYGYSPPYQQIIAQWCLTHSEQEKVAHRYVNENS